MQKLNVRFQDVTKKVISKVAESARVSDSLVARSAMNIGLEILIKESAKGRRNLFEMLKVSHKVTDKESK